MDSYGVLVIILSITLAVFLILSIIIAVLVIRLIKRFNIIVDHAENVAEDVEQFSKTIKKAAVPAAFLKILLNSFGSKKANKDK